MLIDTHCHIHDKNYDLDATDEVEAARRAGVEKLILVGENADDSLDAINFAAKFDNCFAAAGLHPHHASNGADLSKIADLARNNKIVAIGECGIDYYYNNSPKKEQETVLRFQLELAGELGLPLSFHVRGSKDNPMDAFEEFFRLYDEQFNRGNKLRGVVHSFSSGQEALKGVLSRGLYVGLNGIATFADSLTQATLNTVPLESMVLETDAPFLTPKPKRGIVNAPKHLVLTAEYITKQRGISLEDLANITSSNANNLFNLEV